MQTLRLLILVLLFFAELLAAQKGSQAPYERIIRTYAHIQINDSAALPQIRVLIALAKKENNAAQLTKAYHDALHYTPSEDLKLRYADSAITAAHLSCKNDLISTAYLGKGIVYYFNYKRYRPALQEYLKAMSYAEKTDDLYLIHKTGYHLGVVKSYLGDHADAIRHFEFGAAYFMREMEKKSHPNLLHNMRKGYYNSIRQMVFCHQRLNNDAKADSLISIGERGVPDHRDFKLVRSYFHQFRGISEFGKGIIRKAWKNSVRHFLKLKETGILPGLVLFIFIWVKTGFSWGCIKRPWIFLEKWIRCTNANSLYFRNSVKITSS
ncbi:hypothetical protein OK344_09515 [Kaistella sp. BT6-1-3]|uniref:Tetratricopeptide repeat protein n=1 Tax=Kaistella yananensis TaxID=2989820 RepID=A0ABT3JNT7_9FLAO|nr:hypothetical protein [Kaistella yananensis]MCW4452446.1 hypothetical protein [Kaistella yananensis]